MERLRLQLQPTTSKSGALFRFAHCPNLWGGCRLFFNRPATEFGSVSNSLTLFKNEQNGTAPRMAAVAEWLHHRPISDGSRRGVSGGEPR
jgi:hypothetical protein